VYDLMKFWLDKGVDGFRLDVIPFVSKDQTFPISLLTSTDMRSTSTQAGRTCMSTCRK